MSIRLEVLPTPEAVAAAAATEFLRLGYDAIRRQGAFRVALAGGTTPRAAYERIAATWRSGPNGKLAWERVHLFWGDERMVPPGDPRSNYGMARTALIQRLEIPVGNIHRIPDDAAKPEAAAARYERELRDAFGVGAGVLPRFDLVILGIGPDGHTASLFPGDAALDETSRLAVAARHPETGEPRVTLTFPVLNQAAATIVLVTGREKADTLHRVVRGVGGSGDVAPLPAGRLQPRAGTLLWLASEDAAPWAPSESTGRNT
jgi:6-phosphogluconolactonase